MTFSTALVQAPWSSAILALTPSAIRVSKQSLASARPAMPALPPAQVSPSASTVAWASK